MTEDNGETDNSVEKIETAEKDEQADIGKKAKKVRTPGLMRALALAGARGALGLVGVGIAGVSIAAATLIPLPQLGTGPASMVVSPVAATQQRICAGPVLQLGDDTGLEATTAISLGRSDVTRASTSGSPELSNMDPTENESNTPSQRLVLPPPPPGEEPGVLAGSQSQVVDGGEMIGFAASECAKPSLESWLVGGSTETGRTTLLSLNNPSKVSATVSVDIYSESGRVDAAGTEGIVVPPGGRRVLSLAGFAPGMVSPVVHVVSVGGQVTATLQQSIVRTLTPGGIDVAAASTAPATLTVIPGVVVAAHDDVAAASAIDGYADLGGIVRIFVPGTESTDVTITAFPEDGSASENSSTLRVKGGVVTDVSLDDFTDGTWTLSVSSDHPIVAAVRTSTVELDGPLEAVPGPDRAQLPLSPEAVLSTDFAWFVGAPTLTTDMLVSVAAGPSPMVHLVNLGASDASITIDGTQGAGTTVTVPADGAVAVPVAGDMSYRISGYESVQISVSYQGEGALAGFVVSPPDRGSHAVTVFNQYG